MSRLIESAVPELTFAVRTIEPLEHAATPTLALHLDVAAKGEARVRALTLRVEVRIALARRAHDPAARTRLAELFGTPAQWRSAPRALPWLDTTVTLPAFDGSASVTVPLPCTYDFDVTATKYFHAMQDGAIPLDVLFSGTVFFADHDGRLRTARLPWDREAAFELPVQVWKDLMARYFPDTVWLRLGRDAFDRLWSFKARHTLPTWDDAIDALLRETEASSPWTR